MHVRMIIAPKFSNSFDERAGLTCAYFFIDFHVLFVRYH